MKSVLHFCMIMIYFVFSELNFFIDCKDLKLKREKVIRKRSPKSLGSEHGGFEMFSMMDFPNKKLKKYAADPIQRLLYSSKDLGQTNGILTDRDVIDVDNTFKMELEQSPNEEQNNLVKNQELTTFSTASTMNVNLPSNNAGFKPNSVRASDIEFFNNAVELSKPTKKQSSTDTRPTNRRQFPISKASKERLRKMMKQISTLLNEDPGDGPTMPVKRSCTHKQLPNKAKEYDGNNNAIHSDHDKQLPKKMTINSKSSDAERSQVTEEEEKESGDENEKTESVATATKPSGAENAESENAVSANNIVEPNEEENISSNELFVQQDKDDSAIAEGTATPTSVRQSTTKRGNPTERTSRASATSTVQTTIKAMKTKVILRRTQYKTTPRRESFVSKTTDIPTTTAIETTAAASTTAIATITKVAKPDSEKKKPMNVSKVVSRILRRYKENKINKPRIFKISEWRLPLFTVRKPCPVRVDALIRTTANKIIAVDGNMIYIIGRTGVEAGPMPLKEYWPDVVAPISDAYIRPQDRMSMVFFKGRYTSYYNDKLLTNGPNDIAALGIPRHLASFDAVTTWTGNRKTYFFKGSNYWRYNEMYRRFDYGYPRSIKRSWSGVPDNLDTAFVAPNQFLYFVKDGLIYKMEYYSARVKYRYPKRLYDSCYEFFM